MSIRARFAIDDGTARRSVRRIVEALAAIGPGMVFACIANGCAFSPSVTRVVDGRLVQGRAVPETAYAMYLQGVEFEHAGALEQAARTYASAIEQDPDGVELWTRLGAVLCRKGAGATLGGGASGIARQPGSGVWEAFDHAASIDSAYDRLWTERSFCHVRVGAFETAIEEARRAVSLAPNATEPVVALATALHRAHRSLEAMYWLDGLVAQTPSAENYRVMLEFAVENHDAVRTLLASEGLERLGHDPDSAYGTSFRGVPTIVPWPASPIGRTGPGAAAVPAPSGRDGRTGPPPLESRPGSMLARLDEALLLRDFPKADRLALALHLPSSAIALRAAALGSPAWAKERAALVIRIDPSDSDARIALAVAGDLLREEAAVSAAFTDVPSQVEPPSPLGALLLNRLLAWRGGGANDTAPSIEAAARSSDDPLLRRLLAPK